MTVLVLFYSRRFECLVRCVEVDVLELLLVLVVKGHRTSCTSVSHGVFLFGMLY